MLKDIVSARPAASIVSRIETYGYHRITPDEIADLDTIFEWIDVLPVDDHVAAAAIRLRQLKRISLADALIAATALVYELPLCTRNEVDFANIPGLQVVNPFPHQ
jgi:predicted nucleic acid-binding protein